MTTTVDADMTMTEMLLEWVFENALDEDKSGFIEERRPTASPSTAGMAARTWVTALWTMMLREMDTDGDQRIRRRNTSSS